MRGITLGMALFWLLGAQAARASVDHEEVPPQLELERELLEGRPPTLDPTEAFLRAQAVLRHFGVPDEADPQPEASRLDGNQTYATFQKRLPYFDRKKAFPGFIHADTSGLTVYQDRNGRGMEDFSVRFASQKGARTKLGWNGLRIALDPGHMGGKLWDERTGKYVEHKDGRRLSEGLMALQVSLLLEKRLTQLGAQVMITHRTLKPVSSLDYDTYSLAPWAKKELRASTLLDWFQKLLSTAPVGSALYSAFEKSADRKAVFAESKRWKYFVLRADIEARAKLIREFDPDIALIIHFDAGEPAGDPHGVAPQGYNKTKTYVAGGFEPSELSGRGDRLQLVQHALSARAWSDSVSLSRRIVRQINSKMGIPIEENDFGNSQKVESGVFARNLALSRMIPGVATSYVETLYYNDPKEFELFQKKKYSMDIGGQAYGYSDRLVKVVDSLEAALKEFVAAAN